jgi:hypothetical protein
MNGDSGRLVDHQHCVIFLNDGTRLDFRTGDDFFLLAGDPDRRDAQYVARFYTVRCGNACRSASPLRCG